MKILPPEMYLWTRKSLLSFGSHPDPPWQRSSLLECSCVGNNSTGVTVCNRPKAYSDKQHW